MRVTADASAIARALHAEGWCLCADFLAPALVGELRADLQRLRARFAPAAVGRAGDRQLAPAIRSDQTLWLSGDGAAQSEFLAQTEALRQALNRELFLGLFDYEAHYACYAPGAFYRRHRDSFRGGPSRRVLSTVIYLNEAWRAADGGELVLWNPAQREIARVAPVGGTAVFFLSEEFPHEVRPALAERYSIAGWFRASA